MSLKDFYNRIKYQRPSHVHLYIGIRINFDDLNIVSVLWKNTNRLYHENFKT